VIDDGTVMRLEPERFVVFTTTGGAAKILDWMEEWLQTEWLQLRVRLCSLTDHWATFPVVGPRSRALIGSVFSDVDVSNEAFGFMAVRETSLGGVPVRLARVSFSGELAYEVNVDSRYALDLWEIRPGTAGSPATLLGAFGLSSNGALVFSNVPGVFAAVPEPSTALTGLGAMLAFLIRRRR
jgi:sarcosine oxidase subunit alpha